MTEEFELESEKNEEIDPEKSINDFFAGITPGMTVMISRVEPHKYKGLLEKKTVTDVSEPIDLNYLINTWGGHVIRLQFRRPNGTWAKHVDVELYSYDPLVLGQPLKRTTISPHLNLGEAAETALVQAQPSPPPPPQPQSNMMESLVPLMTALQTLRQGEFELLSKLIPQPQYSEPAQQPVSQLAELLGVLMKMQGFFGQNVAPQAPALAENEDQQVMGLLGKAIEAFGTIQKSGDSPRPRISHDPKTQAPIQNIRPLPTLEDQLEELDGSQLLSTFQRALSKLPVDKQNAAMDSLLDGLEEAGIIGGDENDDKSTEQDSQTENSGGAV